jgi:hypothetical protein
MPKIAISFVCRITFADQVPSGTIVMILLPSFLGSSATEKKERRKAEAPTKSFARNSARSVFVSDYHDGRINQSGKSLSASKASLPPHLMN